MKSIITRIKFFRKSSKTSPHRNYFLITSSGQMGTFWLASQLNKHPQIFCSHSYDKPAWGANGFPLDGKEGERQREIIKQHFHQLPLEQFFIENAQVTKKMHVGNVHAYNIDKVLKKIKTEKLKDIKLLNLIRHPISRINSMVKCMRNEWIDEGYIEHLTYIPKIYHEHGRRLMFECFGTDQLNFCDDSLNKQFFIVALILERGTAYQVKIAEKNKIPNIRFEDMTVCKNTMEKIVRHVCGDELIDNYKWFNRDLTYEKINSHTKASPNSTGSIFNGWDDWQKKLYKYVTAEKVFKLYTKYYDDSVFM